MSLFAKLFKKNEEPKPAPEEEEELIEEEPLPEEEEDVDVGPQKTNKEIYDEVAAEMALTGTLAADLRSWTEKLHAELMAFDANADKLKARRIRVCILNAVAGWEQLMNMVDANTKLELEGAISNLKKNVPLIEKDLDKGPKYYAKHVVPALVVMFNGTDNIVRQLLKVLNNAEAQQAQ